MNFSLSEQHTKLRHQVADFASREIAPLAQIVDRAGQIPPEIIQKGAEMGLFGIPFPKTYGGGDLGYLGLVIAIEEIARVCASTALVIASHTSLAAEAIRLFGSSRQQEEYFVPLIQGKFLGAFAVTEPGAGSDMAGITTRAVLNNRNWIINGRKAFITNADVSEVVVVSAKTEDSGRMKERSSLFIVPGNIPGFTIGSRYDKLGLRGVSTVEIFFDDCVIPEENLLGARGKGYEQSLQIIDRGRVAIAALSLGLARACLEASLSYARNRNQFGQPLTKFQAIRFKLADMATYLETARLMTYKAAWLIDNNGSFRKEAAMAKLFASEIATQAANHAIQIHGGAAYTKEYPAERFLRDAKLMEIAEGTSEIMRIVIAKQVGC
ncbi:MAG: acyl-CoA dehydrogenase family protein [Bacillota bacterium]|nr:acyl-CoA dehydrogenase family protein [Bacillota bacterium]